MNDTPATPGEKTSPDRPRFRTWIIPALLIASWLAYVLKYYEIRAFSDPLNWLIFARDFETQIHTSRFAVGFALFLRGALSVLGPYGVFLVNLPVLLAAYLIASRLASRLLEGERNLYPWQAVTASLAMFFAFDPLLVLRMINPYRDPLAYLLIAISVWILHQHARDGGLRSHRAGISGLLLGLACSVREPSILLVVPFGLFAIWSRISDPRIRFWRSAVFFTAGFAVGLLPLVAQSLISTGQALLPAQSAQEHRLVPGMYYSWASIRDILTKVMEYYLYSGLWNALGIVFLAASLGLAIRRRNRTVLVLLLLPALMFAMFYSCYWTFVPRYFYSTMIFAVPAIAWTVLLTARHVGPRILPARLRPHAASVVVMAMALVSGACMWGTPPDSRDPFQIPQARRLAKELKSHLPAGSRVFAERHLCEIASWFADVESYSITAYLPEDVPAVDAMKKELPAHVTKERPAYLLEYVIQEGRAIDASLVDRICGMDLIATLPADAYHLRSLIGADAIRVNRVRNFDPVPVAPPSGETARTEGVRYDFSLETYRDVTNVLHGEKREPTLRSPAPRMSGSAGITLAGPVREGEVAGVEVRLRSPVREPGTQEVDMELSGVRQAVTLPKDRTWKTASFSIRGPAPSPTLTLRSSAPFDLHYVDWRIAPPSRRLEIDVGASNDMLFLRDGWHGRERPAGGCARWSTPRAQWTWNCASPGAPAHLGIEYWSNTGPSVRPPPRIMCNGTALSVHSEDHSAPGRSRWSAEIPAGVLRDFNEFEMESAGWTPGGSDRRQLGWFVDRIVMETTGETSAP